MYDAAKKPFVGLVHQLINIGHVRWTVLLFDCRVLHTMVYCEAVRSAILATAWLLVKLKYTKFDFGWGSATLPQTPLGEFAALPRQLGLKGLILI